MPAAPRLQAPEIETIRGVPRRRGEVHHDAAHATADLPVGACEENCSPVTHETPDSFTTRSLGMTPATVYFSVVVASAAAATRCHPRADQARHFEPAPDSPKTPTEA